MNPRDLLHVLRVVACSSIGGYLISLGGTFLANAGAGFPPVDIARTSGALAATVSSAAVLMRKPKMSEWFLLVGVLLTTVTWYFLETFFGW